MDEFVRLLAAHQRRVFVYIAGLVPTAADADEILQETNLVLWREFARFRPGSNFAAWACTVAMYQVLAWRKKRARDRRDRVDFSEAFLEAVATEAASSADALEERSAALAGCIDRLPPAHREMLHQRYGEGRGVEDIAGSAGRTVEAVYRALSRIRATLHECVTRKLAAEERT
jgi:RNA polymerase sigma-70 factor (ECF subfamily)